MRGVRYVKQRQKEQPQERNLLEVRYCDAHILGCEYEVLGNKGMRLVWGCGVLNEVRSAVRETERNRAVEQGP